jgi:hypothetical protein
MSRMSLFSWCDAAKAGRCSVRFFSYYPARRKHMRIHVPALVLACLAVPFLAGAASAQTLSSGGSNVGPDFYPRPRCEAPGPAPVSPGNNPDAVTIYNLKVRTYNQRVAAMNVCMKDYVDNAQNDINTIQKTVKDAVAAANAH